MGTCSSKVGEATEPKATNPNKAAFNLIVDTLVLPCLDELKATNQLHLLADNNPTLLPDSIKLKGRAAVEKFSAFVLKSFPNQGRGYSLQNSYLDRAVGVLGIGELMPHLLPIMLRRDMHEYVHEVSENFLKNPLFVILGAEITTLFPLLDFSSLLNATQLEDIRYALVYSSLLDAIAQAFLWEEPGHKSFSFSEKLQEILSKNEESVDWMPYFNTFERMKVATVKLPMKYYVARKSKDTSDLPPIDNKSQPVQDSICLQANILEAMYQDTLIGNHDNARAGFQLMSRYVDGDNANLEESVDTEWVYEGKPMGICIQALAFPEVWTNLYNSWNTAFCWQYEESPYFLAKLLNPTVSGLYHSVDPRLYLPVRVVDLYVHIHFVMFARAAKRNSFFGDTKWTTTCNFIRAILSRINVVAAEAYHKRIETTLRKHDGIYENSKFAVASAGMEALWLGVKGLTEAYVASNDSAQSVEDVYRNATEKFGVHHVYSGK